MEPSFDQRLDVGAQHGLDSPSHLVGHGQSRLGERGRALQVAQYLQHVHGNDTRRGLGRATGGAEGAAQGLAEIVGPRRDRRAAGDAVDELGPIAERGQGMDLEVVERQGRRLGRVQGYQQLVE